VGDLLDLPIVDKVYPVKRTVDGARIGLLFLIRDRACPSVCRWKSVSHTGAELGWDTSRERALRLFDRLWGEDSTTTRD
jgi:hypothetical protein